LSFYLSFTATDIYNADSVFRYISTQPKSLQPLQLAEKMSDFIHDMRPFYQTHYDAQTNRLSQPLIVFCTTVTWVLTMSTFFKLLAPNDEAKSRIKELYSKNQNMGINKTFCQAPNSSGIAENIDVLFLTHCVPAGLSIE
jgi:hypothetical protein